MDIETSTKQPIGHQTPVTAIDLYKYQLASLIAEEKQKPTNQATLEAMAKRTSAARATSEAWELTKQTFPSHTPTFGPFLTFRIPEINQLDAYLKTTFPDDFYKLPDDIQLLYHDVNGDGEDDLLVDLFLQVIVMLWLEDHYGEPFRINYPRWKYDPSSRTLLEDWTNDGIPEIIFDYRVDTGGTGFVSTWWLRHIIHCNENSCNLAWRGLTGGYVQDTNFGGTVVTRVDMRLIDNEDGLPTIRRLSNEFSIYCCSGVDYPSDDYNPRILNVNQSTLDLFVWNGVEFELVDEQVVRLPYSIESQASLSAFGPMGVLANVSAESNRYQSPQNDVCQLFIKGEPIGSHFGCKRNFTTVEWRDITNDGRDEVVVTTLSGAFCYDVDGTELCKDEFVHQRLIVYEWDGQEARNIANVAGCVVQEDLYGVRFEDFDHDGIDEILAASSLFLQIDCEWGHNCWYEIATIPGILIYKWNGEKFVFWDDLPGQ
jgi:hypothetical protein